MPKILKKEINHWLAFAIIFLVVASATVAITAKAAGVLSFGGRILSDMPDCSPGPGCQSRCPLCGCGGWEEIKIIPFGGDLTYICPPFGFIPIGGMFAAGKQILGWGFSPYLLGQVGVSP